MIRREMAKWLNDYISLIIILPLGHFLFFIILNS